MQRWRPQQRIDILDLGLPRRDGIEVLKYLRHGFANAAILVLTGRGLVEERVRCLDLGADDFVLKPFSFHELQARCRSLMRRLERFADPVLRFAGLEIDRIQRTVRYEGIPVLLTVREFRLLEFLALRRGGCCSRAELLSEVWHSAPDAGTNIVDVYITYLRKKLTAARPEDKLTGSPIETVRGKGYRMRERHVAPLPAHDAVFEEDLTAHSSLSDVSALDLTIKKIGNSHQNPVTEEGHCLLEDSAWTPFARSA